MALVWRGLKKSLKPQTFVSRLVRRDHQVRATERLSGRVCRAGRVPHDKLTRDNTSIPLWTG